MPALTFLGYGDRVVGIGTIELLSTTKPFTCVIDDLTFGAVTAEPRVVALELVNGRPRVSFMTVAGANDLVERCDDLAAADWSAVTTASEVKGKGGAVVVEDPDLDATELLRRFYRVTPLP